MGVKLSPAMESALVTMYGKRLAVPPVNGRTLAALEARGLVERDGEAWILTLNGQRARYGQGPAAQLAEKNAQVANETWRDREAEQDAYHAAAWGRPVVACDCPTPDAFHYRGCPVMVAAYQGRTADGHKITHGMAVWDYDRRPGYVNLDQLGDDGWFHVCQEGETRGSLMNGERVTVRDPYTGETAADALVKAQAASEPIFSADPVTFIPGTVIVDDNGFPHLLTGAELDAFNASQRPATVGKLCKHKPSARGHAAKWRKGGKR